MRSIGLVHLAPAAGALALAVAGAASCGHSLPAPPRGPTPPAVAFVEVPYPPPPGRVEIVPPRPRADSVWIDGQWTSFSRDRWVWQPGAWVLPPSAAGFTAWTAERRADGRLFFAPPAWRAADGGEVPAPEPLALSRVGEPAGGGRARDERAAPVEVGESPPPEVPAPLLDAGLSPPRLSPDASLSSPTGAVVPAGGAP